MRDTTRLLARLVVRAALVLAAVLVACGGPSRQDEVAARGRDVMPFDLDATTHAFATAPDGGVETVTSDDGDPDQVALVRSHLRAEAEAFRAGDFADPMEIHGHDMPGVRDVADGARSGTIDIAYADVPGGARLTYATDDPALVGAIHDWFDAQVRDHGAHATTG